MMASVLLYRALLWLYPASWRSEYGAEMRTAFAARLRQSRGLLSTLALWLEVLPDLIPNAAAVQFDVLRQDVRYTARTLRRSPGFAIAAVVIGAVGIGATTAAFTMVEHVMIRPFAYARPDRLVKLYEGDIRHASWTNDVAPANFRDWKQMSQSFSGMEAFRFLSVNLTGQGEPQRLDGASLTPGMLQLLGAQPMIGRLFTPADDTDSAHCVILSYGLWQSRFAGDAAVLGTVIRLDGRPHTIIGIMPRDFYFPNRAALLWTTMHWAPDAFEDRTDTYIFGIGRLKPGVAIGQADAEMRGIGARIAREYPKELANTTVKLVRLREDISPQSLLMLKVLTGAALCVLLIACANLANLLLARGMARRRELSVRTALGAGRERLVRQMLTENVVLSLAGGGLGWLLAHATLPLLVKLIPVSLPLAEIPSIDTGMLTLAMVLVCATGAVFGLIPALGSRRQIVTGLHEGGRSGIGGTRQRLRSTLVMIEVAASVMLLVGFGLLSRALWRVQAVDPGFHPDHVLTLETSLPMPRFEELSARDPFYRRVLGETRQLPGVSAASYISFLPLVQGGGIWPVEIEGHPLDVAQRPTVSLRFVTPGFFATMGIPIRAGRDIREDDIHKQPYVAVVSQAFVERHWRGLDPIGRHFTIADIPRTVVGVVGDIHVRGLERASEPQVYLSWQQPDNVSTWYAPKDLVVRTSGDPILLAPALRRIIHQADPEVPISEVRSLDAIVTAETESRRVQLAVLGAFGGVAFLLAAVGIHSLLAFSVSQRTQEIGVRMALGAQSHNILAMTLSHGLKLAVFGVVAGLAVAFVESQWLSSLLFGVTPHDTATFAAAAGLALVMTLAGSLIPTLRAVRIDPTTAIRSE